MKLTMNKVAKQTINPTTKLAYEKLYGRTLSNQEVFEAHHNLIGFFNVLLKIDKRLQNTVSNRLESSKQGLYYQAKPGCNDNQNSNKKKNL